MPRPAAARAVALASSVVLLVGTIASGPVLGRTAPADAPGTATPTVDRSATPRGATARGHVVVEDVGRSVAAAEGELDGAIVGEPTTDDGPDIAAASTTHATINTTPTPALGAGGALTRDASTPSPMIAVGPDHQVRSDDGVAHMSERTGAGAVSISYAELFLLPTGVTGRSARIWFEPTRQRWIAIEGSQDCIAGSGASFGHGYLDVAISDNADPTAGWSVFFFVSDDMVVTRPRLGTSTDKLVVTSRLQPMGAGCTGTGDSTWDLTVLDWADMLSGGEDDAAYFTFEDDADGSIEWLAPSIQQPATSSTVFIAAQHHDTASDTDHTLVMEVAGSGTAATIADTDDLTDLDVIPALGAPIPVPQGAGSFVPSAIPTGVVWRSGRLVIAHTEACTPSGDSVPRDCARIVDLTTSGAGTARRQDFYLAANGKYTFAPGVAFSRDGQLLIGFDQATSSAGPSVFVVRQRATDALGSVSAGVTVNSATGIYRQPNGPDIVGFAPDPLVPDAVWVANVKGTATAGEGDPDYELRTAQARMFDGATYATITPRRVLDTRNAIGLTNRFVSGTARSFEVAGVGAIPANAIAVTANVTVTGQTAGGYLSLTPSPTSNPTSSTLNFPTGDNRANNVTIKLDAAGKLAGVFKSATGATTHLIVDVTGYFVAGGGEATYKPVPPVRLLDTRFGNGLEGPFVSNMPRSVLIRNRGGIPPAAIAISANLTVTGQTSGGYVAVTPTQTSTPTTSTINFPNGDARANGLTIPLSPTGTVAAVFKGGSGDRVHLILDVTGYYLAGASGLRFYPLEPGRILDTRATSLTLLTGKFTAGAPRTLATGGHFGVPGDAQAVTGNLTVTGQSKGGYVSVTRTKTTTPAVSSINFPVGDTRANGITVPLDADDDIHLIYKSSSGATTHLILDLSGYFR